MKIQHKIIEKYIPNYSKMDGETRSDAWNELSSEKVYELNAELLKIDGRGEDFLWLNEIGRGDNDITDYPDLLSFDVPWAAFQKDPENELLSNALSEQPVYVPQPPEGYENRLDGDWVRLMYKGKMHYGNLYCANHYILGLVTEEVDEWLQQRYPTESQMNTYPTGDGTGSRRVEFTHSNEDNWEKYIEGRRKFGEFYQGISSELNKELNKKTPATYLIEGVDYDNSPTLGMICRNVATLSLVRPMTIINDMEHMKANESELEMIAKRYVKSALDYLREAGF